ncbi:MAG TPA: serine/threonine-protein kinase, partial [Ktedonobacteraceae bacterium]|nr:serine/threonine-protein kinase [Ktedonobacteraceae bacterium]
MIETLPAGTELRGRYRIERILGSGGFGHVYLALDTQSKQQFAVKEYLVTGSSGKAQLEHEARVLSKLHHPSLPAFQDAFDELGRYYVVLGYIEGSDLTDCLRMVRQKNETLSYDRILTWLISICDAVTFLHNHQPPVIHRDIKPDNIRITPNGTATLVDLGNAKATEDGARTLFFIRHQGTPGYAPLEQYPGGTGTDERSDVYALGGTLYFALTAHEPPSVSTRNSSISQGLPDLPTMQEILAQNPPETHADPNAGKQFRLGISKPTRPAPRHSRHIAQLASLPPDQLNRLNSIIQRAMAMRPKDRYQTVADMSRDLREVQKALSIARTPPTFQGRVYDPHSTQPDLQFLVDAWQDNQGTSTPPAQDTPAQPAQP